MMGRKPNLPTLPADDGFDQDKLDAAEDAARQLGLIEAAQAEGLEAGIALGRAETATFYTTVALSLLLPTYETVKKSKAWRFARKRDGRAFEDFDEFCQVQFGRSQRRIQELIADRNLLGEELFEQAEKIGLRQIDYNALKALPAPRQEIVKEALAEGATLDDVQMRIQQLAADTQHEIEALKAGLEELKADSEAKDRLLTDKNKKIDELTENKFRNTPSATVNWPEEYVGYVAQTQVIRNILTQNLANLDAIRLTVMQNMPTLPPYEEQDAGDDLLKSALSTLAWEMGETLRQATTALGNVQHLFDQTLGCYGEEE
jgi:hypothetical protein